MVGAWALHRPNWAMLVRRMVQLESYSLINWWRAKHSITCVNEIWRVRVRRSLCPNHVERKSWTEIPAFLLVSMENIPQTPPKKQKDQETRKRGKQKCKTAKIDKYTHCICVPLCFKVHAVLHSRSKCSPVARFRRHATDQLEINAFSCTNEWRHVSCTELNFTPKDP